MKRPSQMAVYVHRRPNPMTLLLTDIFLSVDFVLVRDAAPNDGSQPRDVHLAVACSRGRGKLSSPPHSRNEAGCRIVRAVRTGALPPPEGQG